MLDAGMENLVTTEGAILLQVEELGLEEEGAMVEEEGVTEEGEEGVTVEGQAVVADHGA